MSDPQQPATLEDLLKTLEKSGNLRALARECGFTPGDLKKQLKQWRRDLKAVEGDKSPAPKATKATKTSDLDDEMLALTPAKSLGRSPLPKRGDQILEIWTDGASRGNPGPAAIGCVFGQRGGEILCGHAETIGKTTNNVAEYQAVLKALGFARAWGDKHVIVHMDSELVARQLTGQYRVKSQALIPFYRQIVSLMRSMEKVVIRHVRRDKNKLADHLANLALDGKI
jgi:ribonuclease HI